MLKSYFKIAYRVLYKNKFFTILNVIGLALGMYLCLLFIALLSFLGTFDDFHFAKERIYRVTTQLHDNEDNPIYASAPVGLAQQLENNFTGIEKVTRVNRSLYGDAIYGEKKIRIGGYFADPAFFEIFNFPLLQGNKATALTNPNTIVITKTTAQKIFGNSDALGKVIKMGGYGNFVVTGVLKDLPANSHINFEAIASFATVVADKGFASIYNEESWKNFQGSYIYVRVFENSETANIQDALHAIAQQQYTEQDVKASFKLQPLDDIVPGPQLYDSVSLTWDKLLLFITALMTLIVLIPACSNYINLSISQSLERMKEIGVRKVMGGQRKHIIYQFIVESTIVALMALLLSYVFYEIIPTEFLYQIAEIPPIDLSPSWETFLGFFLFALLVGVVAGSVPAFYFSKISPIEALKGKEVKTSNRSFFRRIVLTTQFMLSLGFIMAVVIMMRQQTFSMNYDFGFEQANVLNVDLQNVDPQIFKHEYGKLPSVQQISLSSHMLGISSAPEFKIKVSDETDSLEVSSIAVDETFIPNMKLELLAGNEFSDDALENAHLIVVNESFAKKLNPKDPYAVIGSSFILREGKEVRIAGILKDFHYAGLKEMIMPFFLEYDPGKFNYAFLKLETNDLVSSLNAMETLWKKLGGEGEFTAQLFSDNIKDAFYFYNMLIKLWGFLGLLAITVTCLGLLGMVSFTTKKRYKEISIRKVMGASSESLVVLLSKDFIILMVIASVLTIPLVYFFFTHLLTDLQHYSMNIGFVEIIISLGIIMVLGLVTILSQTLKAANTNPADNLRTE